MTNIDGWLTNHLQGLGAPFLFAGSGLSRRYAGLESWDSLLRRFAADLPHPYEYYLSRAGGKLPQTASLMAIDFNEVWWKSEKYESSRNLLGRAMRDVASPLKAEIAKYIGETIASMDMQVMSEELDLLQAATVDGIITTNYDGLLEKVFPDFVVFVGQRDLLFADPLGVGELYKIHGSVVEWDTMILTQADYDEFTARSSYLAAKLMTIFVEHPIIFLGYSISDLNVRSILRSILDCLTAENVERLQDRLVFVEWDGCCEPRVTRENLMLDSVMLPITRIRVPDFLGVFGELAQLKRTFPARLLRKLKEHVYELVTSGDPHAQIAVVDIDDDDFSNFQVVFGVGVADRLGLQGYTGIDRWQLLDDIVDQSDRFDPTRIVDETLPSLLSLAGYVPVFKYLRLSGRLDERGVLISPVDSKVSTAMAKNRSSLAASTYWEERAEERLAGISGIADLRKKLGPKAVFNLAACLEPGRIDVGELREFLASGKPSRTTPSFELTQWGKLVCLLDRLMYG